MYVTPHAARVLLGNHNGHAEGVLRLQVLHLAVGQLSKVVRVPMLHHLCNWQTRHRWHRGCLNFFPPIQAFFMFCDELFSDCYTCGRSWFSWPVLRHLQFDYQVGHISDMGLATDFDGF